MTLFRITTYTLWLLLVATVAFSCSACGTLERAQLTPAQATTVSCQVYGRTLQTVSALKSQNKLTPVQIERVRATIPVAIKICLAETPPVNGGTVLENLTVILEQVIFETKTGEVK